MYYNSGYLATEMHSIAHIYLVVVVVTPPLPRDGSTARTVIQVYAVNLIELG